MSASQLNTLSTCARCPRLVTLRQQTRLEYPNYHAAPVGSWGDARARLLIVGLAPGLHGAARTGRAFVGDASGEFLFACLHRQGFATAVEPRQAKLVGVRITNAVKCLPPGNAPIGAEIKACAGFLRTELDKYCSTNARQVRVVVTLGGVAHRAVCSALGLKGAIFGHGVVHAVSPRVSVVSSFHPSRLNVNTRRLTAEMLDAVFSTSRKLLDGSLVPDAS